MNNEDNNDGIVNLAERVRQKKEAEELAKAIQQAVQASEPNPNRLYDVKVRTITEPFQVTGILILTGGFFALGTPTDTGYDFNWAAPVDQVEYVIAADVED